MARTLEMRCTVEVEHSEERIEAHIHWPETFITAPGDRVTLLGPPLQLVYGQRLLEERIARIERAGWLRRSWVRLTGRMEISELMEVSF